MSGLKRKSTLVVHCRFAKIVLVVAGGSNRATGRKRTFALKALLDTYSFEVGGLADEEVVPINALEKSCAFDIMRSFGKDNRSAGQQLLL